MTLDLPTLLVVALVVAALTAAASCLAWLGDRRTKTMLWMALASGLSVVGTICRVTLPETEAVLFGNIALFCALAAIPAACRALDSLPPLWWPCVLPSLTWALACCSAAFRADLNARIALSSAICCLPLASAIWELWKARTDTLLPLLPRSIALFAFASAILFYAARGSMAVLQGGSAQAQSGAGGFALLTLVSIGFSVAISFAMMLLAKERAAQQYRVDAETDALTGLPNRRKLSKVLELEATQARRTGTALALIMIDVDQFKGFNDLYGHPAGDACLKTVASALLAGLRGPRDLVFRYGGEEFAVVLPGADREGAAVVAERLRLTVGALAVRHGRSDTGRVSISLGYAAGIPRAGDAPADLLRAADRALYLAKAAGRDRIHSAEAWPARRTAPTSGVSLQSESSNAN